MLQHGLGQGLGCIMVWSVVRSYMFFWRAQTYIALLSTRHYLTVGIKKRIATSASSAVDPGTDPSNGRGEGVQIVHNAEHS